jgi:DNA-directed RNA polymerase subunit H (RpoH/RPB5)
MDTSIELEDWALPQINKIVKEIKENEGKVSKIKTNSIFTY